MQATKLRTVLIGQSLGRTGRHAIASLIAMVGFYILLSHTGMIGESVNRWLGTNYNLILLMILLVALGAITSFCNNGVIISILVVAGPLMGFFLSGNIAFVREPTILRRIVYAVQGMVLYGVPLGIVGYALGRGLTLLEE